MSGSKSASTRRTGGRESARGKGKGSSAKRRASATARQKTATRSASAGSHGRASAASGARRTGKSPRPDDAPVRRVSAGGAARGKAGKASAGRASDRRRHGELPPTSARATSQTRRTGLGLPATREPEGTLSTAPAAIGLPATGSDSAASHAAGGGGTSQPLGAGAAIDSDQPADLARPASTAPLGRDAAGRGTGVE